MIFYEEVLKAFQREKVKYVLVGGVALNLHGSLRGTADLDILVEMSDGNLANVVKVLKTQGYQVHQPVDPMGLADEKIRKEWILEKHMKAFNFYKDGGLEEVDIIIDSPLSFETARKDALRIKVGKLTLPVVSIDHLIRMKKGTGRAQDRLDVERLRLIKKLKRKA